MNDFYLVSSSYESQIKVGTGYLIYSNYFSDYYNADETSSCSSYSFRFVL